jgi:predicted nicotinamide N-methyase
MISMVEGLDLVSTEDPFWHRANEAGDYKARA